MLFVAVSLSTVLWLKIVFTRYETTTALPVEYGDVNACSVLSGLLFYREFQFMSAGQLTASLGGLVVVIIGVGVSIRADLRCCSKGGGGGGSTAKVAPEPPKVGGGGQTNGSSETSPKQTSPTQKKYELAGE